MDTNDFSFEINETFDADKYTDPSTPDLSLPDSFDDSYDEYINNNNNNNNNNINNSDSQAQQEIYNLKLKNVTIQGELENIKNVSTINDDNNKKVS